MRFQVGRADEFEEVDLTDLRTNGNEIVETRQVGKSASLPSARMSAAAPRPPTVSAPSYSCAAVDGICRHIARLLHHYLLDTER